MPARVRAWTRVRASERFRNTLRLRISAAMVAMACVTALVSGLLVREVSQNQRLDRARDIALARLDTALGEYGATGRVVTPGGAVDEPRLPTELAPLIDRGRKATMLAGDSRHRTVWAAVRIGEHVVSVASPYAIQESAQVDLDRTIVFSGAIGVALAALMGVFVAGGISRRMGHVQRATRRIADGDLEARAGPVRGRDEVAELADSVDRMAGELRERLRTEQRFTGDVAHELRTPLTGLVTAAELLPPRGRPSWSGTACTPCTSWSRTSWRSPVWTPTPNGPTWSNAIWRPQSVAPRATPRARATRPSRSRSAPPSTCGPTRAGSNGSSPT